MKIEILFSESFPLYGDNGNILMLKKTFPNAEFIYTELEDEIQFIKGDVDFVYMGSILEDRIKPIVDKLYPYIKEITKRIWDGQVMLVTGTAFDVFTKYLVLDIRYINHDFITRSSNPETIEKYNAKILNDKKQLINVDINKIPKEYVCDGLGIIEYIGVQRMLLRDRYYMVGKLCDEKENIDILGYILTFTHSYSPQTNKPFCKVEKGYGMNEHVPFEGFMFNNFIATTLLGPLLILNPMFTKYLFKKLGFEGKLESEEKLIEVYNERLQEYLSPSKHMLD